MKAAKVLTIFGLFWTGMTLLFDGVITVPMVRQVFAQRYPSTEGTVLSSRVTEHHSDDGYTYGVEIKYTYVVDDHSYEGHRYRYNDWSSSDRHWADQVVAAHRSDSKVKVFYNASSPGDALLMPGISGSDLFMLAFMTPFNAAALAFWWAGLGYFRVRWFKPVAGGVRILSRPGGVTVRLPICSPLATMIAGTAIAAFLSIFIVGFTAGGFHPSLRTMLITWPMIISIGISFGLWHGVNTFAGKYDLVIDEKGDAVELPLTQGRKEKRRIPFSHIADVYVSTIERSDNEGGKTSSYVATLQIGEGPRIQTERLAEFYYLPKAEAFVQWLKSRLRLDGDLVEGRPSPQLPA